MTADVTHPLVAVWLRDLELLLRGVEPGERAEVLSGVHEHLDASLAPDAPDDEVRRVLAELGSPQSVADEAYAGRPSPTGPSRLHGSPWLATGACIINAVMLVALGLLALGHPHAAELMVFGALFAIPWVVVVVMTSMAPVWSAKQRTMSIGLVPATMASMVLALWLATEVFYGQTTYAVTMSAIGVAAVTVLVRLGRGAVG